MFEDFFNLSNPKFIEIMLRFVLNMIFLIILIRYVYFRYSKKEKFMFTFFLLGIIIFFIISMLRSVTLEFGVAAGLIAVFAVLRFRTRNFSLKDMSYIFATIGISLINSIKLLAFPLMGIIIINIIIILSVIFLEEYTLRNNTTTYSIIYEDLEILKTGKRQKILKELSILTGKDILKYRIRRIDYKEQTARVDITYKE